MIRSAVLQGNSGHRVGGVDWNLTQKLGKDLILLMEKAMMRKREQTPEGLRS